MDEKILFANSKKIAKDLLDILEVELDELSNKEKQLLPIYIFGMINESIKDENFSLENKYNAIKVVMLEALEYEERKTENMLKIIKEAVEKNNNKVFEIMYFQGGQIYSKYKNGDENEVYDNLTSMIDVIVTGEYRVL